MTTGRPSLILLLAATLLALVAGRPEPASASCIASVEYLGASYLGRSVVLAPADVGASAGRGSIPGCNDVISDPPQPPEPSTPVVVRRIPGVAPRIAVAVLVGGRTGLFAPDGVACTAPRTTAAVLACLRRRSAELRAGPSLIAPPGARAGAVVSLTVHVGNRTLRGRTASGVDALLQGRDATGLWRSLFHLLHPLPGRTAPPAPVPVGPPFARPQVALGAGTPRPVRLPDVAPGGYRIATQVTIGSRSRWLFAPLTITGP